MHFVRIIFENIGDNFVFCKIQSNVLLLLSLLHLSNKKNKNPPHFFINIIAFLCVFVV